MTKRILTDEEQEWLRKNPNVVRCTDRSILYSNEFKRTALHAYYQIGTSPRTIFIEAGFPDSITATKLPKWTIDRWRRKYGTSYEGSDLSDKRGSSKGGGRPRKNVDTSIMTDKEKLKYYEARVAYQEAENAFLAKARGLKRWPTFVWEPGNDSQ